MSNSTRHALQLPLRSDPGDTTKTILWDDTGDQRIIIEPNDRRDAAAIRDFVKQAVNTHESKVEALDDARTVLRAALPEITAAAMGDHPSERVNLALEPLRALLAKLGGGP